MGDTAQKRPLEDGEEPGPKKIATFTPGSAVSSFENLNNAGATMSESMKLPDDLVGLIIGRSGENIMRMQRETGCRIQITQSIPGSKERPCTLSGTPEQIEVCKNMLNEIISRSQAGTLGNNFNFTGGSGLGGGGGGGPGPGGPGGMGEGQEKSVVLNIPPDKCGLIIGKGGETIKMLQQNLCVRMLLIQDTTENVGRAKPLKISGSAMNVDNAANAIQQMMAQRDKQIAEQKMSHPGMASGGGETQTISVPKPAVGVVIGKGGDMISQIQNVTATRIQFKPEDPGLPERLCTITGSKEGVDAAISRVQEIIQNVQERDGGRVGGNMGGGGGGGGPGMGNFGHWDNSGMQGRMITEQHLVPANRTGLVIGKGGETIKQINMQSGAHAEIEKNPPPGSDLNYKTFVIKGTPEQVKMARQLIQEKVDSNSGGGMNGGPMGGPPQQGPPGGNFMPPQPNAFNNLPSGANFMPQPNPLQTPPQMPQQAQQFRQPWAGQFQQWTPPAATAAAVPAAAPQPATVNPTAIMGDAAKAAAWQPFLQQMYNQPQVAAVQAPAASTAAAAVAQPAAAAAVPDYSKQWDEYLKRTGALQAAAAAAAAPAAVQQPAAAAAPAVATPAAAAAAPAAGAAAQPATTQADYSAAWAEYYRQYYELQGQQYAAAVAASGQAPAQT